MNRLLVLSLIVLSAYYVNCLIVEEKLCESDLFNFNGKKVNTYFRVSGLNATLPNATKYLLNDTIDLDVDFFFRNEVHRYNGYVRTIFTEDFIKSSSDLRVDVHMHYVDGVRKNLKEYNKKISRNDKSKYLQIMATVQKTIDFLEYLRHLKNDKLHPQVISVRDLNATVLAKLPLVKNVHTLILDPNAPQSYFGKSILQIDDFKYNGTANGTLSYTLYIPNNDKHYKADPFDRDCKRAWLYLPKFYQKN